MRLTLNPAGHRVPQAEPTCLSTPRRLARHRPFAPALNLHQRKSSRNLHLQYSAKSQSTPRCQSLIIARSDHPLVLGRSGPISPLMSALTTHTSKQFREKRKRKETTENLKQVNKSRKKTKQDHLSERNLGPLRQGQHLDKTEI
jgi:hypothetical protein